MPSETEEVKPEMSEMVADRRERSWGRGQGVNVNVGFLSLKKKKKSCFSSKKKMMKIPTQTWFLLFFFLFFHPSSTFSSLILRVHCMSYSLAPPSTPHPHVSQMSIQDNAQWLHFYTTVLHPLSRIPTSIHSSLWFFRCEGCFRVSRIPHGGG